MNIADTTKQNGQQQFIQIAHNPTAVFGPGAALVDPHINKPNLGVFQLHSSV